MADGTIGNAPIVKFEELPAYAGVTGLQVVCVKGGADAVRVDWEALNTGRPTFAPSAPAASSTYGEAGQMYVGESGLFTWETSTGWAKTPRVTSHWEDLDTSSRFLLVNKDQSLSEQEQEQGRSNLGVGVASEEKRGLVKQYSAGDIYEGASVLVNDEGSMSVPLGTADVYGVVRIAYAEPPITGRNSGDVVSIEYVDARFSGLGVDEYGKLRIDALPVATYTSLGGVQPSPDDFDILSQGTLRAKVASCTDYGYVKLAVSYGLDSNADECSLYSEGDVPTVGFLEEALATVRNQAKPATSTSAGIVRQGANINIANDGTISVPTASVDRLGVVKVASIEAYSGNPTAYQGHVTTTSSVYSFVTKALTDYEATYNKMIPSASYSVTGGVKLSDTVAMDASGAAYVPQATEANYGAVKTVSGWSESSKMKSSHCTTVSAVIQALQAMESDLLNVTLPATFMEIDGPQHTALTSALNFFYNVLYGAGYAEVTDPDYEDKKNGFIAYVETSLEGIRSDILALQGAIDEIRRIIQKLTT